MKNRANIEPAYAEKTGGAGGWHMVLDWEKYKEAAVHAVEEGIVLLENRNGVLPLKPGAPLAVYGRIQLHYYKILPLLMD